MQCYANAESEAVCRLEWEDYRECYTHKKEVSLAFGFPFSSACASSSALVRSCWVEGLGWVLSRDRGGWDAGVRVRESEEG